MPSVLGYRVSIVSHGQEMDHHGVYYDRNTAVCYIQSDVGKEFEIQYDDYNEGGTFMDVECFIDGQRVAKKTADPGQRRKRISGVRTSATTCAAFKFSAIVVVDDDEANGVTGGPCMGLIEVRLHRVQLVGRHTTQRMYQPRPSPLNSAPISEKSKKGGWHQISLGSSQTSHWRPSTVYSSMLDSVRHPLAVFRFYYRPKEILQAEGIIARPWSSASHDNDVGDRSHPSANHKRALTHDKDPGDPRARKRSRGQAMLTPGPHWNPAAVHSPTSHPRTTLAESSNWDLDRRPVPAANSLHHDYLLHSGTATGQKSTPSREVIEVDSDDDVKLELHSPIRAAFPREVIDLTLDED
ncbi:hypothetical protein BV25DRAFT_1918869 [Artomyces pyxidatus]|uniref:Uncharacterized protein n=1 Tax=Artomyces pyxidatus TaxID=48021 RepID=A0ACB8SRW5_9AGAM|nr:hypothetical protein BV25DRAFT_1918869 [Artomyces pyxidatus]